MMKHYLITIFLLAFLSIPSFAQLTCDYIDPVCQKAHELMDQGQYEQALRGLEKAKSDPGIRNCSDVYKIDGLISQIQKEQATPVPPIRTYTVNGVSFKMVAVEGGQFTMGAAPAFADSPKLSGKRVKVSGFIIDDSQPLVGAIISEKGCDNPTVAMLDGDFSMEVNEDAVLVVTYVGYKSREVMVGDKSSIVINMSDKKNAFYDETPAHTVRLNDFMIGQTEVTQALWKAVMGSNPSRLKGDNLPVENVSWTDCQTFISKLNVATGQYFRLPTEAEWEYAARGGANQDNYVYSGSNDLNEVAWYWANSGDRIVQGRYVAVDVDGQTHDVGGKKPNSLGLYDMSGNVREWCQDYYDELFYTKSSVDNPCNREGTEHVTRGGDWGCDDDYCRTKSRDSSLLKGKADWCGLRLAM